MISFFLIFILIFRLFAYYEFDILRAVIKINRIK